MNFGELKDLAVYYLDDLNYGYFTETQVARFINNAQFEAQKLLIGAHENWYYKCSETTLVNNQNDYILPDDFLKVIRLEIVLSTGNPRDVSRLEPITVNQQDMFPNDTGTPNTYFLRKNRIWVMPAPDQPLVMRLHYAYRVAEMTLDAQEPDIPQQYHELLSVMAARDGRIKDDRDVNALLERKFSEYEKMMKEDANERTIDQPRRIVQTDDIGYIGFI